MRTGVLTPTTGIKEESGQRPLSSFILYETSYRPEKCAAFLSVRDGFILNLLFSNADGGSDPDYRQKKKSRERLFLFVLFTLLSSFFSLLFVLLRDFFQIREKREKRKEESCTIKVDTSKNEW